MSDRITDKTLGEAALNPDGKTYNGVKAVQWITEALTGKAMSEEDVKDLWGKAQKIAAERRAK